MSAVIIFVLILAILLVIFTLQNSMEISINVFFWEIANAPLVLVLIVCVVLGYLVAALYFYPRIWKIKKEMRQLLRFNKELKELHEMNRKKSVSYEDAEETNPEGIELDDEDDEGNSFFKE